MALASLMHNGSQYTDTDYQVWRCHYLTSLTSNYSYYVGFGKLCSLPDCCGVVWWGLHESTKGLGCRIEEPETGDGRTRLDFSTSRRQSQASEWCRALSVVGSGNREH